MDIDLQVLQARSLARYFDREGLGRLFLVWNDVETLPADARERLRASLGDFPHDIIMAESLGVASEFIAADGWTTKQVAKLLISRHVNCPDYLVLDSKNFLVHPCAAGTFTSDNSHGPFRRLHDLSRDDLFLYALRFFDVQPEILGAGEFLGVLNATPFSMRSDVVRRMILRVEGRERCGLAEVFFRHQHLLTEFFAYQAFAIADGQIRNNVYCQGDRDIMVTAWWQVTSTEFGFMRLLDEIGTAAANRSIRIVGVHWIAFILLSSRQTTALSDFLVAHGLCEDEDKALEFIKAVREGIRRGKRDQYAWFVDKVVPELNSIQLKALSDWRNDGDLIR